ncbi:hypothetical protein CEXT_85691 [Caerostris extrusa]|uniref:Uncharacterized protein n=1 Tax=Caerostris extrusa TaxID=172846 RepID=A0AAV4XF05_CAEEX|nr:hypothetical protein CEXT_85691 [Caerostris extrusa]
MNRSFDSPHTVIDGMSFKRRTFNIMETSGMDVLMKMNRSFDSPHTVVDGMSFKRRTFNIMETSGMDVLMVHGRVQFGKLEIIYFDKSTTLACC